MFYIWDFLLRWWKCSKIVVIVTSICEYIKNHWISLAWWPSWLEFYPLRQKVASSIPDENTYLGCTFDPQLGAYGRQLVDVSFSKNYILGWELSTREEEKRGRGWQLKATTFAYGRSLHRKKDPRGLMKSRKKEGQLRERGWRLAGGEAVPAVSDCWNWDNEDEELSALRALELNCLDLDPYFSIYCMSLGKIFHFSKSYCFIY